MSEYLFEASQVKPCVHSDSSDLAHALIELVNADKELYEANRRIPGYTGNRRSADCVATEQEAWNRAADAFRNAIRKSTSPNLLR